MRNLVVVLATIFLVLCCPRVSSEEYADWLQKLNVPTWVHRAFGEQGLKDKYAFSFELNPCYLRGDFSGDGEPDIAILVKEISSGKLGAVVLHFGSKDLFVLGAGESIGNGGDDFKWMTNWTVKRKGKVNQGMDSPPPPQLIGEALHVEKAESASAIIYWDGSKYTWYQQGD